MATKRQVLFGARKTADMLGITPRILNEEVDNGLIVAHQRGRLRKFKPEDIEEYEKRQTINNGG